MAWIIEEYIRQLPYIKEQGDIESDSYNNALMVEKAIKYLAEHDLLNDFEKEVLEFVYEGYNYSEIARLLDSHRLTVSDTFSKVTDRIAFILGGEFTDTSFIERIHNIEELSEQDINELFKRGVIKAERNV